MVKKKENMCEMVGRKIMGRNMNEEGEMKKV